MKACRSKVLKVKPLRDSGSPWRLFDLKGDPVNTQDFNRERFAGIGIVVGNLFDVASLTPEMKESLRAGTARSLG